MPIKQIIKISRRFSLIVSLLGSSSAYALSLQGSVRIVGSALQSRTMLESTEPQQSIVLCPSVWEQKIRHLTDLGITISGEWRISATGANDCFEASSYKVLKAASGRPVVVGLLVERDGRYILSTEEGGDILLSQLPSGAKSLIGSKVILDVKSIASSTAADATKVIVSIRSMP
jgi:hypothetical protein